MELGAGDLVEFQGLQGATHLNGTQGYLVRFLRDHQRWAVRCKDSDEVVRAKPTNLKRVNKNPVYKVTDPTSGQVQYMQPTMTSQPIPSPSRVIDDFRSLHDAALDSFHNHGKGGVVISCGDKYMVAIEFDGPYGAGGVYGEMVYVDKNRSALAVVRDRGCARAGELGRNFLMGETVEYIDTTNEDTFFKLLSTYKRGASTQGLIDVKSGLYLYQVQIPKL